jgi:hypothetical protein
MITIRASADSSTPALAALEATLTVPIGVYTICSKELMDGSHSPFSGALFGAILWPRSRFQLAPGIILEQQMFLPHDRSAAACSWQLHSPFPMQAHLTVKPFSPGAALAHIEMSDSNYNQKMKVVIWSGCPTFEAPESSPTRTALTAMG